MRVGTLKAPNGRACGGAHLASRLERLEARIARTLHGRFFNACAGHSEETAVPLTNSMPTSRQQPTPRTKDLAFEV